MIRNTAKWTGLYGLGIVLCLSALGMAGALAIMKAQEHFREYTYFSKPVVWMKLETGTNPIREKVPEATPAPAVVKPNTDIIKAASNPTIAEKICAVFTDRCEVAVAVATAESNLRPDAIGMNDNTIDVGLFQINYQTHKGKEECSLEKISTVDGNINCAHRIYRDNGNSFSPWVAYKTGAYLARIK